MKDEINKIINWIEMGYTRLNYKEELSLVDYIKQLQQENQKLNYNWNKLRKTLKNEQLDSILYSDKKRFADIDEILLKIQELEKGDSNE